MKLFRIFDKLAIMLPKEICEHLRLREGTDLEINEMEGVITIQKRRVSAPRLTDEEKEIVKKLISIKFKDRTPELVNKKFDKSEKKILTEIVRKGYVGMFKSGKYPKEVYSVPPSTYSAVIGVTKIPESKIPESKRTIKLKIETKIESKKEEEIKTGGIIETDPVKRLYKEGFVILSSLEEAKELSEKLSSKIRKREIRGVRGFDKNYYILTSQFISKYQNKIKDSIINGNYTPDKISSEVNLDKKACIALLTILNEEGEIIEKRRGKFALAD